MWVTITAPFNLFFFFLTNLHGKWIYNKLLIPMGYNELSHSVQFWMFSHPSLLCFNKTHNTKPLISYRKYNFMKENIKWKALQLFQMEIFCQKLSSCFRKTTKNSPNNSWKYPLKAQIPCSHPNGQRDQKVSCLHYGQMLSRQLSFCITKTYSWAWDEKTILHMITISGGWEFSL